MGYANVFVHLPNTPFSATIPPLPTIPPIPASQSKEVELVAGEPGMTCDAQEAMRRRGEGGMPNPIPVPVVMGGEGRGVVGPGVGQGEGRFFCLGG